jgi:ABC-type transport system involved in multi-copper enzyme maturation permease subunit
MNRLLRAEWRKVFTVKLWWGMLLGALAFTAIGVAAQIATSGSSRSDLPPLSSGAGQHSVYGAGASAEIFALIVGIIVITSEYRHFTSRPTFLFEPRRGHVIVAKIVLSAAVGLLYAACCVALTLAIATPWLAAKNVTVGWSEFDLVPVLLGVFAVVTIYSVVGLGLGVLVRNQVAAVIGAVAYLFVLEPLITVVPVVKDVHRFLPGGATAAVIQSARDGGTELLSPWQGGLVLVGWGLLFAAAGWLLSVRRDVQ